MRCPEPFRCQNIPACISDRRPGKYGVVRPKVTYTSLQPTLHVVSFNPPPRIQIPSVVAVGPKGLEYPCKVRIVPVWVVLRQANFDQPDYFPRVRQRATGSREDLVFGALYIELYQHALIEKTIANDQVEREQRDRDSLEC